MSRWRRSPAGPAVSSADILERTPNEPAEQTGGRPAAGHATPDLARPSVLEMAVDGKESTMSPSGARETSTVSLSGSLATFTLADVLTLLASTSQTGELHALSEDIEGWLWLSDGQLANARVGSASTIGQAVFELARITDGEFSFVSGVVSSSGHPTVPVTAVLQEVRPQVDEWHLLRSVVPLDAEVNLAPDPPGEEIRIRNDQWSVLTAVGTSGLSVRAVLERIGGAQIAGLRTLRDLQSSGLIAVRLPGGREPDGAPSADGSAPSASGAGQAPETSPPSAGTASDESPSPEERPAGPPPSQPAGRAEVTMVPPPITVDPWARPTDVEGGGGNGVA